MAVNEMPTEMVSALKIDFLLAVMDIDVGKLHFVSSLLGSAKLTIFRMQKLHLKMFPEILI